MNTKKIEIGRLISDFFVKLFDGFSTNQVISLIISAYLLTLVGLFVINPWLCLIAIVFWTLHWFSSLHFQHIYLHCFSSHETFRFINISWQNTFHVCTWLTQGVSYLIPSFYGFLHLEHHNYSDTKNDPHSPTNFNNIVSMMRYTAVQYGVVIPSKKAELTKKYGPRPEIKWLDKFGGTWISRLLFFISYVAIYVYVFSFFLPLGFEYLILIPTVAFHIMPGPVQGALVNWYGHYSGNRNFDSTDNSHNTPWNIILMGEGNQNNHHKAPNAPNFGFKRTKWYEIDLGYPFIYLYQKLGIITIQTE